MNPQAEALDGLSAPHLLLRPARLYAAVVDETGAAGQRHFLAELPEGAAVFPLAAPGVSFLLVERDTSHPAPLAPGPVDAAAIDAWYGALLSWPGLAHGDAIALPMEVGESRSLPQGTRMTARRIVWLQAAAPVLRYVGGSDPSPGLSLPGLSLPGLSLPSLSLLVLGNQINAEVVTTGDVQATTAVDLLAGNPPAASHTALGALSAAVASWIAGCVVGREAASQRRAEDRLVRNEAEISQALRRLDDVATLRTQQVDAAPASGRDPLEEALAAMALHQGFTLRAPASDDRTSPLFDRLLRFGNATGFRFREIALDGEWWKQEGPPILAVETATGMPRTVIWRRGRWRVAATQGRAEVAADATALMTRGYMIYPSLPDRATPRQIWQFAVFGARGDVVRLLLAAAAATLAALLIPVATSAVLGFAIPDGRTSLLADMMILLLAATIGGAGFQVVRAVALIRLGTHVNRRLQPAVWDRVMRLRTSFFRKYTVGDLTLRILGVDAIRRILAGQVLSGLIGGVFSLASLGIMLVYDASLAALAVLYAMVAAGFMFLLGRQQMRMERRVYTRKGLVTARLMEILGGIAKLRVAAAEGRAFARWSTSFADQRANDAQAGRLAIYQTVAATSLPILSTACVLAIAGGGTHPLDVASFAAFNSAFGQFTTALVGLTASINAAIEAAPLLARIRPVFEAPLEVEQGRIDPGTLGGQVAVRNLSFRYAADGPWILDGVDFEAHPGESLAIVGASGSGKSTLLRLLLGFETPMRGGVFYDDRDSATLDLRLVRSQIGTVLETSTLTPGSIYDNIAGGAPLPREHVMEAVRQAGFDADLKAMPMGLETFVMEGGSQLSGGQRQRVMIAQALVRKPRLIFLDQATSALDNQTQAMVSASLAAMNATRIVIAHRLSTIRDADRILVLERGKIVETGSYDELIARDGALRRLVERQML